MTASLRTIATAALVLLTLALPAAAQDPPASKPVAPALPVDPEHVARETSTASQELLGELLGRLRSAEGTGDALKVAEALAALTAHDNAELVEVGMDALKYRASKLDKQLAKVLAEELETTSKSELQSLIADREAAVQAAGAHVLASLVVDDKGSKPLLRSLEKAFKDKSVRRDKPTVVAAVIRAFGRQHHGRVEDDVVSELRRNSTRDVARACVLYLGDLPTRNYKHVRLLCEMLDAPEPASVQDASNPGESYWKAAWESWNWTRRDVSWSLKQVTGQVFAPAEGDHPSDAKKALAYIDAHREELGLD